MRPLNWSFFLGIGVGICVTLAWTISHDLDRLGKRIAVDTEISKKLIRLNTEDLKCEINLGQVRGELADCMTITDKVDYILWEVHALDKDPGRLEPEAGQKLCDSIGTPSTYRAGTHLSAYNFWNAPDGKPMLGCRYLKAKEEP